MNEVTGKIEKARVLLSSGQELKAVQLLSDTVEATDDPHLLEQIHQLAVQRHEQASGLRKIHWNELVLQSEARLTHPVS